MRELSRRAYYLAVLVLAVILLSMPSVHADCPGNLLFNPGFEGDFYKGDVVGTSLSSWVAEGWVPWSLVEGQQENREPEFSAVNREELSDGDYRVHGGDHAQKFFTLYATHTSGFCQRVRVTPGSRVIFSIWVQIATGQDDISSGGHPISDLEEPGEYRVFAGIDPRGGLPPTFGARPPARTVWSDSVEDYETRTTDEEGYEIDAWVQLSVSAVAQERYVTVYTKGQPKHPVKHNDSFWDDACLIMEIPPTATNTPTDTSTPTATFTPTNTRTPTATPTRTETAMPTATEVPPSPTSLPPTETFTPSPTPLSPTPTPGIASSVTPVPSAMASPSPTSASDSTAALPPTPGSSGSVGFAVAYVGLVGLIVMMVIGLRARRR